MQAMIIKFLTSAALQEFGKRLFLMLAREYAKDTKTKVDDKTVDLLDSALK